MDEITDPKNDSVFMKDQYLYGIRWRGTLGYGFWQQAVISKEDLTAASFQAARLRMLTFRRDGGDPLGIMPTHLVVDPVNEAAARDLLERQEVDGSSNPNYHAVALIVLPWLLGSGNANLGGLSLSTGTLSPAFDPAVTEYTASVANGVTSITATGVAEDGGVSLGGDNGQAVSLSVGANAVTITVTASDGTTKTYTVTVTRAAP
jgi:hypothetical protein